MSKITYRVVKHDGGWAYEANGTYSEQFQTPLINDLKAVRSSSAVAGRMISRNATQ